MAEKRNYEVDYDMNSPQLAEEWDEVIADLHQRCPMARSEVGEGYWVALKQEDIKAATQDWETFSSATGFMPDRPARCRGCGRWRATRRCTRTFAAP